MQLEPGILFKDPTTDFVWQISTPWMNWNRKKQVGWICQRAGFHPEQPSVSKWFEHEIIHVLSTND
ncbi:MAG TPA: hypothetical protein V6C91_17205 [Coleofasciculaceae cyanobacterium]